MSSNPNRHNLSFEATTTSDISPRSDRRKMVRSPALLKLRPDPMSEITSSKGRFSREFLLASQLDYVGAIGQKDT